MELEWNLTILFKNREEAVNSMEEVKRRVLTLKDKDINISSSNDLLFLLDEVTDIKRCVNNVLVYFSLMYYKNVKDSEIENLKKEAEFFFNEVDTSLKFVDILILNLGRSKVLEYIKETNNLKVYEHYLDNLFRTDKKMEQSIFERIKLNNDNINAELNSYNKIISNLTLGSIVIGEEEVFITLSNVGKYLSYKDRNVREEVFNMLNSVYLESKSSFANILNSIMALRIENANLEGFSSALEKSLFDENINPLIVSSLISSVSQNLFLIQKYLEIKAKVLDICEPHLYDFGTSIVSDLKMSFSLEEAIQIIREALKPLGEDYLNVVDILLNGHIDATLDERKHQSIIFSWNTYSFMNFKGTYADIKNLIHEIGHIVNYYLSKEKQIYLYEDSTIFVGECAALVNEILLNRYLYSRATSEEEKLFYLSKDIENMFTTVFKQTMYTEFQMELFKLRSIKEISADELCKIYEGIIKKYYGENIVYDDCANIEWARLGHLFRYAFYNYKYATGLLISNAIVNSLMREKSINNEKYIEFLSSGSSMYSLDLLQILNIDLTDTNVINGGFKELENNLEEMIKILRNKY